MQDIAEDLAIVFETVVGDKGRLSPGECCLDLLQVRDFVHLPLLVDPCS